MKYITVFTYGILLFNILARGLCQEKTLNFCWVTFWQPAITVCIKQYWKTARSGSLMLFLDKDLWPKYWTKVYIKTGIFFFPLYFTFANTISLAIQLLIQVLMPREPYDRSVYNLRAEDLLWKKLANSEQKYCFNFYHG